MHTIPSPPSTPTVQDGLDSNSKPEETTASQSMAVCQQPIVSAKDSDNNTNAMEMEGKAVVTPEGPKTIGLDLPESITTTTSVNETSVESMDRSDSNEEEEEEHSQADSSDGESSYFVKHLPSPKSGRRYSAPDRASMMRPSPYRTSSAPAEIKSSDASLSFSDDDEDDEELPLSDENDEQVAQLPSRVADMQLSNITRVHSYSSLVSSNSSNSRRPRDGVMSPESSISRDTSDNNSVNAEHSTVVASPKDSANYKQGTSSQAAGYQQYPVAYAPHHQHTMQHLQQQHPRMSSEQMSQWMSAQMHQPRDSTNTLPFVYSDDEAEDAGFMHHLATGGGQGGGGAAAYNSLSNNGRPGGSSFGSNNEGTPSGGNSGSGGRNSNEIQRGSSGSALAKEESGDLGGFSDEEGHPDDRDFRVYWQRWIMLFYMSILNLLSDWTCYSVAPIAILTKETFGDIDPERLVVIFLGANAISTACEPIILARLGLKKTVLLGALFLMLGSMVKSGGLPPFIQAELRKGEDEWRLSFGFFLVGLSQPLYQCTPALLSASWFPEKERTMATGVALNANQLGIGCAFVFGTLLVATSDDIPSYFGLLSMIATVAFFGTLFQFDDAPPTPPSSSAKVIRGDITVPDVSSIMQSVRDMRSTLQPSPKAGAPAPVPSPGGLRGRTAPPSLLSAPSPMMPGPTEADHDSDERQPLYADHGAPDGDALQGGAPGGYPMYPGYPPHPSYQNPYAMPPGMQPPPPYYQQQPYYYPPMPPNYPGYQNVPYGGGYPPAPHPLLQGPGYPSYAYDLDEGAEPVVTISDHHLDINIRDDQVILSIRACLSRPGFMHSLVSFVISGIVINTLSTYMDYLVTLNGAGREMVGIIGGSFQGIIMMSSLIIGSQTDKTRAYYSVIIAMLVLGAFGLAQAGVSLDADRGNDLRYALLICAALIGPLQPVSTELGVEVAYPLSENTVLVIQQLFSNLLSALFIPFFKMLKDIGINGGNESNMGEKTEYTFSFYLLILLHAGATVFFATFNGRYLRYEHELEKEAQKEQRKEERAAQDYAADEAYAADSSVERSENHPLTGGPTYGGFAR